MDLPIKFLENILMFILNLQQQKLKKDIHLIQDTCMQCMTVMWFLIRQMIKVFLNTISNTKCQVCGISDRMSEIRAFRRNLPGGDFVYAAIGDIPWPDNSFDTIFFCKYLWQIISLIIISIIRFLLHRNNICFIWVFFRW